MAIQVKLNEGSVDRAQKLTEEVIRKVLANKQMLNEVGVTVVTDFKFTTKRGDGVDGKITPPKQDWRQRRDELANYNQTDPAYRKNKAYTFTGQLINSFMHFVIGPGKINFRFDGLHLPYKNKDGKRLGNPVRNELIAQGLNKRSPFIGVRPKVIPRLKRIVVAYLRRSRQTIIKLTKS